MTYRALCELVPPVPAFLTLEDVLAIVSLIPKMLQASSCLRSFAPALPPIHMLSLSPLPSATTGSFLSSRSQLICHLHGFQVTHPLTPALWSTFSCCIFFLALYFLVYFLSHSYSSLHYQIGCSPRAETWPITPSPAPRTHWGLNFYCQMRVHGPGTHC